MLFVPTRRPPKASMADVARAAGVSVTTVSHVVNRIRVVSPDTERAVLAAVAECGYVPESTARSLRQVGARTIGVAGLVVGRLVAESLECRVVELDDRPRQSVGGERGHDRVLLDVCRPARTRGARRRGRRAEDDHARGR